MILTTFALALPLCPAPAAEILISMMIETRGHQLGGLAAVAFDGEDFSLVALSPAGPELFTVQTVRHTTTVTSPFPAWIPWLRHLPFERDLRLIQTPVVESCRTDDGHILVRNGERRWRGRGGPARAQLDEEGRTVLVDPWRRYTLRVKAAR